VSKTTGKYAENDKPPACMVQDLINLRRYMLSVIEYINRVIAKSDKQF
jgi:hypothetical protein